MKIPDSVQVGPICYTVAHSQQAMDAYNAKHHEDCVGSAEHSAAVITLADAPSHDNKADTLLHEVLHAVLSVYNLRDKTADEHFVALLATTLLDTLRRNPALVAYLVEVPA